MLRRIVAEDGKATPVPPAPEPATPPVPEPVPSPTPEPATPPVPEPVPSPTPEPAPPPVPPPVPEPVPLPVPPPVPEPVSRVPPPAAPVGRRRWRAGLAALVAVAAVAVIGTGLAVSSGHTPGRPTAAPHASATVSDSAPGAAPGTLPGSRSPPRSRRRRSRRPRHRVPTNRADRVPCRPGITGSPIRPVFQSASLEAGRYRTRVTTYTSRTPLTAAFSCSSTSPISPRPTRWPTGSNRRRTARPPTPATTSSCCVPLAIPRRKKRPTGNLPTTGTAFLCRC